MIEKKWLKNTNLAAKRVTIFVAVNKKEVKMIMYYIMFNMIKYYAMMKSMIIHNKHNKCKIVKLKIREYIQEVSLYIGRRD